MSEEMEALPCPFCGGQVDPDGWLDGNGKRGPECEGCGATAESMDVWNSRAALQESEAGAFGTVVTFEDGSNVFRKNGEPFPPTAKGYIATEVYAAPPSAQAIETAAIMRAAYLKGYEDGIAGKPAQQD